MKTSKHTLYLSSKADDDLKGIYNYVAYFLYNIPAAQALLNKFDAAFERVEAFPESCSFDKIEKNYRTLIVDNYIAFYKIENDGLIRVYRILYGKMDLEKNL